MSKATVNPNPFTHIAQGTKRLLSVDITPATVMLLLTLLTQICLNIGAIVLVANAIGDLLTISGEHIRVNNDEVGPFLGSILGFGLLTMANQAFFGQAFTRVILMSIRKRTTTISEVFAMTRQRFGITMLTYLAISGMALGAFFVVLLVASMSPALGILVMLGAMIGAIVLGLWWIFVSLLLIDDEQPAGLRTILAHSKVLWLKSRGAVLLFLLAFFASYTILSSIVDTRQPAQTNTADGLSTASIYSQALEELRTPASQQVASITISSILATLATLFSSVGITNIYNEATTITEKETSSKPKASPKHPPKKPRKRRSN